MTETAHYPFEGGEFLLGSDEVEFLRVPRESKLVTLDEEVKMLEEYISRMREYRRITLQHRNGKVPISRLIATQQFVEGEKYDQVVERIREGTLTVPVLVEAHYDNETEGVSYYMLDGHTRGKARFARGDRMTDAFIVYFEGDDDDFQSGYVVTAHRLGDVLIPELPIFYKGKGDGYDSHG